LIALYDLSPEKVVVVANGTDTSVLLPATTTQKHLARKRLGYADSQVIALFMASYHGPNNQALEHILSIAPHCPQITFVVLGSVKHHALLLNAILPQNVSLIGVVSEADKLAYLASSDIALNPMTTGSGTNLKMLDYAAAGLLIVSTSFGGRGGMLQEGRDYIAVDIENTARCLTELAMQLQDDRVIQMRLSARQVVQQLADWRVIAQNYAQKLQNVR
jgi:glycosyltransferase involved in cell wall biosynthesis